MYLLPAVALVGALSGHPGSNLEKCEVRLCVTMASVTLPADFHQPEPSGMQYRPSLTYQTTKGSSMSST